VRGRARRAGEEHRARTRGEKIDIIRYYGGSQRMLEEAIRPAVPEERAVDERNRRIYFEVAEKDLATAIGPAAGRTRS